MVDGMADFQGKMAIERCGGGVIVWLRMIKIKAA